MKDYCHPINPAEKGPASMEGTSEFTIPQLLHRCAETMGDKPALRVEREKEERKRGRTQYVHNYIHKHML